MREGVKASSKNGENKEIEAKKIKIDWKSGYFVSAIYLMNV